MSNLTHPFDEHIIVDFAFGFLYFLVFVFGVGGNSILVYIILGHKRMRTKVNAFIFMLAMCDMLIAGICANPTYYSLMLMYWPFGSFLCTFNSFLQAFAITTSMFSMLSLCLDRYLIIIFPFRDKLSMLAIICVCGVVVLSAIALTSPLLLVVKLADEEEYLPYCHEVWPQPYMAFVYSIISMALQYVIPLFFLIMGYGHICFKLWVRNSNAEEKVESNASKKKVNSNRKLVKMLILVVILFAFCWFPLHVYNLAYFYNKTYMQDMPYVNIIFYCVHLLAMAHSCMNPLIFYNMNNQYKYRFRKVFCVIIPLLKMEKPGTGASSQQNYTAITRTTYSMSQNSKFVEEPSVYH